MPNIAHHSDDFIWRLTAPLHEHPLPNRVDIRKELMGKCLIHHGHLRRTRSIVLAKVAAADQRNTHGGEIAGSDDGYARNSLIAGFRNRPPIHPETGSRK